MKILVIGDPHGDLDKVKKMPLRGVDLILLNGDLGSANLMRKMFFENINREKQGLAKKKYSAREEKRAFMEAYNSTIKLFRYLSGFAPVYTIFGNVESSNSQTRKQSKAIGLSLPFLFNDLNSIKGVKVIGNRVINFHGIKIGGLNYFVDTAWVKTFKPFNYLKRMKAAKKETASSQKFLNKFGSVDILLCHQPPWGILDKVTAEFAPKSWQGKHSGSQIIRKYLLHKKPRYVFCGHIHEAQGMKKVGKTEVYNLGFAGYKIIEVQ